MPIKASRYDYILTTILFFLFLVSFFLWSTIGDLHFSTNPDPAHDSKINMAVYVIPLFLIYEMFTIYYFNGMPRIRELDKEILMLKIRLAIKKKIEKTKEECHQYYWKKKL
jgi:hypothetical protein